MTWLCSGEGEKKGCVKKVDHNDIYEATFKKIGGSSAFGGEEETKQWKERKEAEKREKGEWKRCTCLSFLSSKCPVTS